MKLEGKLKEGFFEWFVNTKYYQSYLSNIEQIIKAHELWFKDLPQSARFGLIQEYAEDVLDFSIFIKGNGSWFVSKSLNEWYSSKECSRPEAEIKVVEQLNEIVNK